MTLNEYIKMSYERPNRKVLEGLGASEGLIEYLMETPGNTNLNVVESIANSGGDSDTGEVWYIGTVEIGDEPANIVLEATDKANSEALYNNYNDYNIFINGMEMKLIGFNSQLGAVGWSDSGLDDGDYGLVLQYYQDLYDAMIHITHPSIGEVSVTVAHK